MEEENWWLVILPMAALVLVWLYGNWVSRQDDKEGREINNDFGM